ncbi:MAG: hypothetical protein QHH06_04985 [Clostridiales bacterium]|jgi:hypothetical protein|nr:hypothetical protein [Eubacteriales bacterium]MDH7565822.1 hypothetical protein [Clostridiales bacterium]
MKCMDCKRFTPQKDIEASRDIAPNTRGIRGTCSVNNKTCNGLDSCECGGFEKR